MIVPPIALQLAKHPAVSEYDLSSIRYILCGAAPLSADLQSESSFVYYRCIMHCGRSSQIPQLPEVVEKRIGGRAIMLQGYGT